MANVASVGVAKQTAFGAKNTTLTPIKVTSINSSDLDITRIENDELFGGINTFAPEQGLRSASVGVDGRAYPGAIGYFLNMVAGDPTTTGAGPYVHTFVPGDALPPRYTVGMDEPNGIDAHFVDVLVSSFGLTQEVGDVLTFSVDGISSNRIVEAVTVPTAGIETRPFRFNDFTATVASGGGAGASVVNFKSLNLSIDNPVENIYALNGSDSAITQEYTGRRSISLDGTMRFVDDASSYRAQFEANTTMELVLTWTIDANTSLVITIPDFRMESHNWTRGFDETEVDFSGGAFQDTTAGNAISFELTNSVTAY